jgi:hypothetical protein
MTSRLGKNLGRRRVHHWAGDWEARTRGNRTGQMKGRFENRRGLKPALHPTVISVIKIIDWTLGRTNLRLGIT